MPKVLRVEDIKVTKVFPQVCRCGRTENLKYVYPYDPDKPKDGALLCDVCRREGGYETKRNKPGRGR